MERRDIGIEMERRTYTAELRVVEPSLGKKGATIRGYAAKFNSLSEPMPIVEEGKVVAYFREQLMPGCFASAIPVSDIRALFNHDPNLILGRTTSGTLRIAEDEVGLAFENDPPDTTYSRDLQISMQRGDINQCSFGFNIAPGGDSWTKDTSSPGNYIRSIHQISKLYDASPVTYPAYVNTDCAVRTAIGVIKSEEAALAKAAADKGEEERNFVMQQRELELQLIEMELGVVPEKRVDMGYASRNTVGTCSMCNSTGCVCSTCENVAKCNLQTTANGGACTMCMKPNCLCLTCVNTDQCMLLKMYQL